jgi:hypothetical protein
MDEPLLAINKRERSRAVREPRGSVATARKL